MKIIPIKTGQIKCNKGMTITLGKDLDKTIYVPSTAWLILTSEKKILVDTGMCSSENATNYPDSVQGPNERIDLSLKKVAGISPEEIDIVIFTHLHWDHCANHDKFINAKFYVQRKELEFAKKPIPPYWNSYDFNKNNIEPSWKNTKFELIDGDAEITPGVKVIATYGHSPGHQSVLVDTNKGTYCICGDAVMSYENFQFDEKKRAKFTMIGRYMDIIGTWESFEKIKTNSDFILPGHDFKVYEKEYYGDD